MVDGIRLALALVLLAAFAARASSVTDEVFVNSTQATDANPRSSLYTNALNGNFDVAEDVTLNLGVHLTLQGPTPAATRAQFGDSGSVVTLFTAGVDWSVTDNLTLGATVTGSPSSTQYAGTMIGLRSSGVDSTADAQLRSTTSQIGAGLDASWDTLGKSNLEWSFDAGVDFIHYDVDQSVSAVNSTLTPQQIRQQAAAFCLAHPRRAECARGLQGAVGLDFERFSGTVLATIFTDTDVSLSGDWYLYDEDPAAIGFFGLATQGRGPNLPIAPLQYLVRPEVLHRFGDFSAKIWAQAGEYVSGTGYSTAGVGLKLQYRFSKAFRLWATAYGQRDEDVNQQVTRSGTVSVGAGYRW